jgi:hypothetical protein
VCFGVVVEYFHVVEGASDPCDALDQTPVPLPMNDLKETIARGAGLSAIGIARGLLLEAILAILSAAVFAPVAALLLDLLGFQRAMVDKHGLLLHRHNGLFAVGDRSAQCA